MRLSSLSAVHNAATALLASGLMSGLMLSACAVDQGPSVETRPGLACIDDSTECIGRRQTTLRQMVEDPAKSWVREPATPHAYASGVRLFAFKSKKKDLTCEELAHGKREADNARASLKQPGIVLSQAQVARSAMLAAEVSRELEGEMKRRCQKG